MDFIEEITPKGIAIKILFNKWQFLAFDKKGRSIYADSEGRSLLHHVPLFVFVGNTFSIFKQYEQEYTLLKVRKNSIVLPYKDLKDKITKYIFIPYEKKIDLIPVRMLSIKNVTVMIKELDAFSSPDFFIVDETISSNDIIIIKNRYKVEDKNFLYLDRINNYRLIEENRSTEEEKVVNLNMLSSNPVYLSRIHLRNMDLSKVNQLLLDFDLTALDSEYIMNFIENLLKKEDEDDVVQKNKKMLLDLRDAFRFYLLLLQRNDEDIRTMINAITETKKLTPYRTLISKVKSLHPGNEEQILYTEYENIIADKSEELQELGHTLEEDDPREDQSMDETTETMHTDDTEETGDETITENTLENIEDGTSSVDLSFDDIEQAELENVDESINVVEDNSDELSIDGDLEIVEDTESAAAKQNE